MVFVRMAGIPPDLADLVASWLLAGVLPGEVGLGLVEGERQGIPGPGSMPAHPPHFFAFLLLHLQLSL